MAEEFQLGNGNWWDNTSISRNSAPTVASTTVSNMSSNYSNWQSAETQVDIKPRTFLDSGSVLSESSGGGGSGGRGGGGGVLSADNNFQMMGLGLTSQPHDWNQSLLRGEKAESGFSTILQQGDLNSNTNNYQLEASNSQQHRHWNRQKIYSGNSEDSSSVDDYKQMNFVYNINPSTNYGLSQESAHDNNVMNSSTTSSWSKFPQFLRTSPPEQQPLPPSLSTPSPPPHSQLHFSNNTPFWNANAAAMNDVPSTLFPSNLHPQLPITTIDEKAKNTGEIRDISRISKKTNGETSNKRPRDETPSPSPAFKVRAVKAVINTYIKVRKEKMGDRITALQQLVSPFGKTDTASVLSEAIEYIKFLHDQIGALSAPYMKSGSSVMQHQQSSNKSDDAEGQNQDLRNRGLCLVPVSSTFPVTHETTVDFWTPTFGGKFK